jgi:hypothetical protein
LQPAAPSNNAQRPAIAIAPNELVAQLREQLADMREGRDRARTDAETWRNAFETERAQRLALTAPRAEKPMIWWRWLRAG